MPGVAVLVPLSRDLDADRAAAWSYVLDHLERTGWPVHVGFSDAGAWSKGTALAQARVQADASVLVIHDADVIVEPRALELAVRVLDQSAWAIPHGDVFRLTPVATEAVLAGGPLFPFPHSYTRHPYQGYAGGGITVVADDVWDDCPIDPRFVGWGCEDECWGWALDCLHGPPVRFNAPLWHLWHEHPAPNARSSGNSPESHLLWRAYRAYRNRPDLMRTLLAARGTVPA